MYLVRDKSTKRILHVNPAPVSQNLTDKDVYFDYNPKTMEVGKTDEVLPEFFDINEDNMVVEISLEKKVTQGLVKLQPQEKIVNNQIVEKSMAELVAESLVNLQTHEKIENNQIVEKSLSEQVKEGLTKLSSNQKLVADKIVQKSLQEMLDEKLITLDDIKVQKTEEFASLALSLRQNILPDYKIQNALMGIYDEKQTQSYKSTIEGFRAEFYRLKSEVEKARDPKSIEAVKANFPAKISSDSKAPATKKKTVKGKKKA